jgi:hypothetical protein
MSRIVRFLLERSDTTRCPELPVAGNRAFLLLFVMVGLLYAGLTESVLRAGTTAPLAEISLFVLAPFLVAFLGYRLRGTKPRLGYSLIWSGVALVLWNYPFLTGVFGLPMWLGAWAGQIGTVLSFLSMGAALAAAAMISMGREPRRISLSVSLLLMTLLGIAIFMRTLGTWPDAVFVPAAVLMIPVFPLYLASGSRAFHPLATLAIALLFAGFLIHNLNYWLNDVYSKHLILGVSRVLIPVAGIFLSLDTLRRIVGRPEARRSL